MRFATAHVAVTLGLLSLVSVARAEETKIPIGDLPKVVVDAIKMKFPTAEMTQAEKETEGGKTTYELGLKDKGMSIDVAVTSAGKIVEIEKTIAAKDLPKAVTSSVLAKYPGATITKAEEIVEFEDGEDEKSYEVVLTTKDKKSAEVKLSPKGKILENEGEEHEAKGKRTDLRRVSPADPGVDSPGSAHLRG